MCQNECGGTTHIAYQKLAFHCLNQSYASVYVCDRVRARALLLFF